MLHRVRTPELESPEPLILRLHNVMQKVRTQTEKLLFKNYGSVKHADG